MSSNRLLDVMELYICDRPQENMPCRAKTLPVIRSAFMTITRHNAYMYICATWHVLYIYIYILHIRIECSLQLSKFPSIPSLYTCRTEA